MQRRGRIAQAAANEMASSQAADVVDAPRRRRRACPVRVGSGLQAANALVARLRWTARPVNDRFRLEAVGLV